MTHPGMHNEVYFKLITIPCPRSGHKLCPLRGIKKLSCKIWSKLIVAEFWRMIFPSKVQILLPLPPAFPLVPKPFTVHCPKTWDRIQTPVNKYSKLGIIIPRRYLSFVQGFPRGRILFILCIPMSWSFLTFTSWNLFILTTMMLLGQIIFSFSLCWTFALLSVTISGSLVRDTAP